MRIKKSNKFWKKAKLYIPGGNMIFSKRPELMSPGNWPYIIKKQMDVRLRILMETL